MQCSDKERLVWYSLLLCTSNMPAAGTDADVFVTIHGKQGSSPRIKLPSSPTDFLPGSTDTFRMELQALEEIVQLTVGHNNRGQNPGWHLSHAELTDEESGMCCQHVLTLSNTVRCDCWFGLVTLWVTQWLHNHCLACFIKVRLHAL